MFEQAEQVEDSAVWSPIAVAASSIGNVQRLLFTKHQ